MDGDTEQEEMVRRILFLPGTNPLKISRSTFSTRVPHNNTIRNSPTVTPAISTPGENSIPEPTATGGFTTVDIIQNERTIITNLFSILTGIGISIQDSLFLRFCKALAVLEAKPGAWEDHCPERNPV